MRKQETTHNSDLVLVQLSSVHGVCERQKKYDSSKKDENNDMAQYILLHNETSATNQ